jgi:hypothetical protein
MLILRRFRSALKTAVITIGGLAVYLAAVNVVSLLSPQTIVKPGDSYCFDIWCIGVDRVSTHNSGQENLIQVDVHIFSDANTVKVSAKARPYLVDENGRRFPLIYESSAIPFDAVLDPGQTIKTSLMFKAAPDARQLFLTGDVETPPPFPLVLLVGMFHKPTLFRVL